MENEIKKICSDLINGEVLITKHYYDQVGTIKIKCVNGTESYTNESNVIFGLCILLIFILVSFIKNDIIFFINNSSK
jgi:hypothetical protein